jgi:starch synthase
MRVAMMTREYPPEVYGGAGVHVTELVAQLRKLCQVDVHCQGAPRPGAFAYQPDAQLRGANPALSTLSTDLVMAKAAAEATVVHSHTWYAGMAGHLASLLHGVPHVLTAHSLEPLRPWKAEQLGGGYALSSWCEQTAVEAAAAVIAVSGAMRDDLLAVYPCVRPERARIIRNGIDTAEYSPDPGTDVLSRYGIDARRPTVIFIGRVTRQKGLPVLLRAAAGLDPAAQLVVCAGQADTPEIDAEVTRLTRELQASRGGVIWLPGMLERREVIQLLTQATVFACPSLYEPLGIVNLEAMACGTAVAGSRTGGIPEVVADGVTGLLVPPDDPGALTCALNELVGDPPRAAEMGRLGRERAVAEFG